MVQH
jgi:hypothetical protein